MRFSTWSLSRTEVSKAKIAFCQTQSIIKDNYAGV
jgi:hypothetical protein